MQVYTPVNCADINRKHSSCTTALHVTNIKHLNYPDQKFSLNFASCNTATYSSSVKSKSLDYYFSFVGSV